jgi:hypothetical protein
MLLIRAHAVAGGGPGNAGTDGIDCGSVVKTSGLFLLKTAPKKNPEGV